MESFIIKVCGLNSENNVKSVENLALDYTGMIFFSSSKRFAGNFPSDYKAKHARVAVFVDAELTEILELCNKYQISTVQLHGNESPEMCKTIKEKGITVWKAFGIDQSFNFNQIKAYEAYCDLFLFDTKTPLYGGSGLRFDWSKLKEYQGSTRFLLSGGIGPDAIDDVLQFSHPMFAGVDLNSRFESSPGVKDLDLLKPFVDALRAHYEIK